jgi:hypothetical protein
MLLMLQLLGDMMCKSAAPNLEASSPAQAALDASGNLLLKNMIGLMIE